MHILKMGVATSLYVMEISVTNYEKKYLLVTKSQMKRELGEILVKYLSLLDPYNSRENFINSLYSQLSEPILIDGISLSPGDDISYRKKEKYMIKYLHSNILKYKSVDLDSYTSINIFPIEDMTPIKI